jgi:hypothetical protein
MNFLSRSFCFFETAWPKNLLTNKATILRIRIQCGSRYRLPLHSSKLEKPVLNLLLLQHNRVPISVNSRTERFVGLIYQPYATLSVDTVIQLMPREPLADSSSKASNITGNWTGYQWSTKYQYRTTC